MVWFAGTLDGGSVGQLNVVLSKTVGEQPDSIVVDLTRVHVVEKIYLTALITAAHKAMAWPGCPIALVVTDPDTVAALRHMGATRYLPVCPTYGAARRRLADMEPPARVRLSLVAVPSAVEIARERAYDVCQRWGLDSTADAAATLVTELVTNAIVHAGTPTEVSFGLSRPFLYIAVRDQDPRPPVIVDAEDHGDGLRLVEAFAAHWGWHDSRGGKVVWASVRLPYGGGPAQAVARRDDAAHH